MKKIAVCALVLLLITGCSGTPSELDTGLNLRSRILQSSECAFTAIITADYGDQLHTFSLDCQTDSSGNISFTVAEPESISGIAGKLTGENGSLTFDDTVLYFPLIADGQLSPVSAPWILMNTLRSGFLSAAGMDGDKIRLTIDDSFEEDALQLDIWLDHDNAPEHADILYGGMRILSVDVKNFVIL